MLNGKSLLYLLVLICLLPAALHAAEVKGPETAVRENNIVVSTGLALEGRELSDFAGGVQKEIVFYIDLFKVWNYWPDEFVLGRKFVNTLKCDPVKKEYIASSLSGGTLTEKRFPDCAPLIDWALNVRGLRLTNVAELEPGDYFVRVTVESRLRTLPPVISSLFFFIKEKEFAIYKDTALFPLRPGR